MATKKCKYCKSEIDAKASICPQCNTKQHNIGCLVFLIAIVIIILFVGIASCSGGDKTDTNNSPVTTEEGTVNSDATSSETKPTDAQQSVPSEYKSALKKAKIYSDTMHMSKQGLYDQLTSEYGEKFSPEAAQYAIDNLVVDYNKNALEKAKSYQQTMSMSPAKIHDQLTSEYGEKFTKEEADYAIENLE